MVYGPIAAYLVEAFPARIRYTALSLPYHIGNGVFGGLLPLIGLYVVSRHREHLRRPLLPDRGRGHHLRGRVTAAAGNAARPYLGRASADPASAPRPTAVMRPRSVSSRTQNPEPGTKNQNLHRRTWNLDRRAQNLDRRTQNLDLRTRNLQRRTWNLEPGTERPLPPHLAVKVRAYRARRSGRPRIRDGSGWRPRTGRRW